jgi:hypothetical protein
LGRKIHFDNVVADAVPAASGAAASVAPPCGIPAHSNPAISLSQINAQYPARANYTGTEEEIAILREKYQNSGPWNRDLILEVLNELTPKGASWKLVGDEDLRYECGKIFVRISFNRTLNNWEIQVGDPMQKKLRFVPDNTVASIALHIDGEDSGPSVVALALRYICNIDAFITALNQTEEFNETILDQQRQVEQAQQELEKAREAERAVKEAMNRQQALFKQQFELISIVRELQRKERINRGQENAFMKNIQNATTMEEINQIRAELETLNEDRSDSEESEDLFDMGPVLASSVNQSGQSVLNQMPGHDEGDAETHVDHLVQVDDNAETDVDDNAETDVEDNDDDGPPSPRGTKRKRGQGGQGGGKRTRKKRRKRGKTKRKRKYRKKTKGRKRRRKRRTRRK